MVQYIFLIPDTKQRDLMIKGDTYGQSITAILQSPQDIIYLLTHLRDVNGWEALLSFSMASIVLSFRELLQPRIYQRLKVVIPIEFFLFIVFSGLSYGFKMEQRLGIRVVGNYTYSFSPVKPQFPDFSYMWDTAWAGLVLAIVSYTVTLESAYVLARKYGDRISPNQELLALGASHVFGSFFWCFPAGASVGRGQVNQALGSRSQVRRYDRESSQKGANRQSDFTILGKS